MDEVNFVNQRSAARNVLRSLAHGLDPVTGQLIASTEIVHEPSIIRALILAAEALSDAAPAIRSVNGQSRPQRTGQSWSHEEDEELRDEFKRGVSVLLISKAHERSRGAITSRIEHLNLFRSSEGSQ